MLRKIIELPLNVATLWWWSLAFLMVVVAPVLGLVSLATGEIKPCDDSQWGRYAELSCSLITGMKTMLPIVGGLLIVAAIGIGILFALNRGAVNPSADQSDQNP